MPNVATALLSRRKELFACAAVWIPRLAFVLLPWQTRWFLEAPLVNGYAWEYGRLSFYISWLAVGVGCLLLWLDGRTLKERISEAHWCWVFSAIATFIFASVVITPSFRATVAWWMGTLAALTLVSLGRRLSDGLSVWVPWFLLGLVIPMLVGFLQTLSQDAFASSWLGLAAHDPAVQGTAVVVANGIRFLRAYGVFPHPNISGAWLALALVLACLWGATLTGRPKKAALAFVAAASAALVLTFSRTAWIGAACGLIACAVALLPKGEPRLRRNALLFFLVIAVSAAVTSASVFPQVKTRIVAHERLEQQSTDERFTSWRNGLQLLHDHVLFGRGLGVSTSALLADGLWPSGIASGPPEPPHDVVLVAISEIGVVGFLVFVWLLFHLFYVNGRARRFAGLKWPMIASRMAPLIALAPPFLLDHFIWTLWPGKALAALAVLAFLCQRPQRTIDDNVGM